MQTDVRPKQQTHHPARLDDYEVEYVEYPQRDFLQRDQWSRSTERGFLFSLEFSPSNLRSPIPEPHHNTELRVILEENARLLYTQVLQESINKLNEVKLKP